MYIYIYKADQIILDNNPPIIHIIYIKKPYMLSPRVSGGPRYCQMDGYAILNTQRVLDSAVVPAKRHPDRVSGRTLRWFC